MTDMNDAVQMIYESGVTADVLLELTNTEGSKQDDGAVLITVLGDAGHLLIVITGDDKEPPRCAVHAFDLDGNRQPAAAIAVQP